MFSRRQSSSSRNCQLARVLQEQEARALSARQAGIQVRLNIPADLPGVALDSEHLGHVLSALLDNAREALPGPGAISVSARQVDLGEADCQDLFGSARPGPHVEITIADTGIGLSPDVRKRLFSEPFFTTKPRRRGFGLAISYGILHAHRGGLRLHPGEEYGVVARVLLPVAAPQPAVQEMVRPSASLAPRGVSSLEDSLAAPRSAGGRLHGERVLVVDDEPEVLQVVATSLERAGYRVDGVSDGEAALERYFAPGGERYALVVTDVVMPGLGGVDLVQRLLKRDPTARVLFISGHVSSDFPIHDFANQGFELLNKPFRTDHLLRAVRSSIDRTFHSRAGQRSTPTNAPGGKGSK
jgi:CheY-like chemotaxis protein